MDGLHKLTGSSESTSDEHFSIAALDGPEDAVQTGYSPALGEPLE